MGVFIFSCSFFLFLSTSSAYFSGFVLTNAVASYEYLVEVQVIYNRIYTIYTIEYSTKM